MLKIPGADMRSEVEPESALRQTSATAGATQVVTFLGNPNRVKLSWHLRRASCRTQEPCSSPAPSSVPFACVGRVSSATSWPTWSDGAIMPCMEPISVGNKHLLVVGDRVLVEPETGEKTTEVGLILPANAVAKESVQSGVVRAVGPGTPLPPPSEELEEEWREPQHEARYVPMQVKVNDHVTFFRKAAIEISVERTNYLVVPQHAILVLTRDPRADPNVPDELPEEMGEF